LWPAARAPPKTCPKGLNPARMIAKTKEMMAERG
jgi:succinate dehydrogenase/fumarate reductase-like Fe-S protein